MKNKVLATLLAVCLFAGLAVPAFASDLYSSVEGSSADVTEVKFSKSEVTVKQDSTEDLNKLVTAYVSDKAICLNPNLTWNAEGDTSVVSLNDGQVTAIEAKGTTTVTATSENGKHVAKIVVKCAPKDALIKATGFTVDSVINVPVDNYYKAVIKVDMTDLMILMADTKKITVGGVDVFTAATTGALTPTPALIATAMAGKTFTFGATGTWEYTSNNANVFTFTQKAVATATTALVAGTSEATIAGTIKNDAASPVTLAATDAEIVKTGRNVADVKTFDIVATPKDATFSLQQLNAIKSKVDALSIANGATTSTTAVNGNKITVTFAGQDAGTLTTADKAGTKFEIKFTSATGDKFPAWSEDDQATAGYAITKKFTVKNVEAKPSVNISTPGAITIEVGERQVIDPKIGASDYNIDTSVSVSPEPYGTDSVYDYAVFAPVKDSNKKYEVVGVAVGTNKLVFINDSTGTTSTTVVNVVKKGTKPTDTTGTTTTVLSNWTPKLGVGETANIVVKATAAVTYTSLATDIVTVDAAGKLTAVKEGTAKVKVQEEGKDAVYLTVTIGAATTKPADKPTDVPQTAVAALVALF